MSISGQTANPPESVENVQWLSQTYGPWTASVILLVIVIGVIWWKWDEIKSKPLVRWFLGLFRRPPKAGWNTFTVDIARLSGDEKDGVRHALKNLLHDLKGVDVRLVSVNIPFEKENNNHAQGLHQCHGHAQTHLLKRGARLLIWGGVGGPPQGEWLQLYFTTQRDREGGAYPLPCLNEAMGRIEVNEKFNSDFSNIVRLAVATEHAAWLAQVGKTPPNNLSAFLASVRQLTQTGSPWGQDPIFLAMLGNTLQTLSEVRGGVDDLTEAVAVFGRALAHSTTPETTAMIQNDLGIALRTWGGREVGTTRLEQAVAAFENALNVYTQNDSLLNWATTQNNLGAALQTWGEREEGTARLEQAVETYENALKVRTQKDLPLKWAMTQNNLGNTLQTWGGREEGTMRLGQAVETYKNTLEVYTQKDLPLDWAMTQNNLGAALQTWGGREEGTVRLEQAIAAYKNALKVYTKKDLPLAWARTQNNLGNALSTWGEREKVTTRLKQAVRAFKNALKVITQKDLPLDWAMTQNNLGNALNAWGEREAGTARLEQAVAAYENALKVHTPDGTPYFYQLVQKNLARAQELLARRKGQ